MASSTAYTHKQPRRAVLLVVTCTVTVFVVDVESKNGQQEVEQETKLSRTYITSSSTLNTSFVHFTLVYSFLGFKNVGGRLVGLHVYWAMMMWELNNLARYIEMSSCCVDDRLGYDTMMMNVVDGSREKSCECNS